MSGIEQLAEMITTDLEQRLPGQRKTQRDKLALLVATMLQVRSANLMDVAACLPRPAERLDRRYQWIKRFLANTPVVSEAVMAPYGREVLTRLSAQGQTVVLLIDQTPVNERHQAVMVAVRLGGRALPLGSAPDLAGEGDPGRDRLCRAARGAPGGRSPSAPGHPAGADRRPLLRQPRPDRLVLRAGVGLAAAAQAEPTGIRARRRDHARSVLRPWRAPVERYRAHRDPRAPHVAMGHEAGHPEPWIIALSQTPSVHTAFDDGLRWGIEAMVSDFK